MPTNQDASGAGADTQNTDKPIVIGDKSYSTEDLASIIAQASAGTQASQQLAGVQALAARYGMTVEELATQAEGSFSAVADLLAQGVIDESGRLVKPAGTEGEGQEDSFMEKLFGKGTGGQPDAQAAAVPSGREKALADALKTTMGQTQQLAERLERLERDNTALLQNGLRTKLQTAFPELKEDTDVSLILGRAQADRSKSLLQHAQAHVESLKKLRQEGALALAKQLGIEDLDAHLNSLKSQDPSAGIGARLQGKKPSLSKKGDGFVHPRDAAKEFLDNAFK